MTIQETLLTGMRNAKLLYAKSFDPLVRKYGVAQLQWDILLFLHHNPGFDTAQSICDLRGLSKSNVSNAVEELVQRGYLVRSRDGGNRRVVHLAVTEAAKPLITEGLETQQSFFGALLKGLDGAERRQAAALFAKINDNLSAMLSLGRE